MIKHSPLPWSRNSDQFSPTRIFAGNNEVIAKVYLVRQNTRRRDDESLGNANIITGAGAMYEALCAFRDDFGFALEHDEPIAGADTVQNLVFLWPQIKAALDIIERAP